MQAACPTHAEATSPIARSLAWVRALRRFAAPLLAIWLALAAGWAVAADGVVIALVGSVSAERADAAGGAPTTRALGVGSELSQGDLVRTGPDGRTQIRFSDGGLVSLQPATDFRIDEYRFDAANERSFFSLLRGALRSATGAIGKRDRENYRLRTPTATIGIRGTEFLAEETVCAPVCAPGSRAGLKVSVTQGRIAITTRAGTLEVGEGQSAEVESPDAMPRLASAGPVLGPIALPTIGAATTAVASSAATNAATTEPGSATATAAEASPTASAGTAEKSAAGSSAAPSGAAPTSGTSKDGTSTGGAPAGGTQSSGTSVGGTSSGAYSAGELGSAGTAGTSVTTVSATAPDGASPLAGSAETSGSPNLPGPASTTSPALSDPAAAAGSAAPASPATSGGSIGAAAPGSIAAMPLPDRSWPAPAPVGSATAPNSGDSAAGTTGTIGTTNPTELAEAVADQSGDEPPPQVGDSISTNVRRDEDGSLIAVAGTLPPATGIPTDPTDPTNPTDPTDPPDEPGPAPEQSFISVRTPQIPGFSALQFDSRDARPQFDEAQALLSIGTCPSFCLSRGSARAVETGFESDVVAWGRWTGGTATLQTGASSLRKVELGPDQGIHYLIGAPSQTVPTSGSFSYSLIGATSPTLAGGGVAPGQFAGSAAVWFGPGEPARIGIDATVTIGGARIGFATAGGAIDPAASQLRTGTLYGFSGTLGAAVSGADPAGCGSAGCTVDLRGGLFGPDAARLGFTYSVEGSDPSRAVGGAAVFGKK